MAKKRVKGKTPGGFAEINHDAAGIDVGNAQHWVAVPAGRDTVSVRMFGCFTADLHTLANWLMKCGIKTVAMESTGVYWIALYEILESRGVPGLCRKRSPSQESTGAQDGCKRLSVASAITYLWTADCFFPAPSRDHHLAAISPPSRNVGAGSGHLHSADPESTH